MAISNGIQASPVPSSGAEKLRQLLNTQREIIVAPGVFDGLSARVALDVGFDCLYMTGAGTSASKLGQPDLGFLTLNDMSQHAEMIANLDTNVPLIADADTGFGGPNMVARTIERYHRSGVAALHIEDQIQSKRCGHLEGKQVVSREDFFARIAAAIQARTRLGSKILIIARTDALQTHNFDEAIIRLKAAFQVGADIAFFEGLTSKEQGRQICEALAPHPVLLNMVENGATPTFTPAEAQEAGFRIVIFPFVSIFPALEGMRKAYRQLKKSGTTLLHADDTPKKLFSTVGLEEAVARDSAAGGMMYEVV